MRHSTIFKSRWMALLWSAGIIWFAADVANGSKDDPVANVQNGADDGGTLNVSEFDDTAKLVAQLNAK